MKGARKQAIKANGLSHMCEHCEYKSFRNLSVCRICNDAFREGFVKGAKWAEKGIKEHQERVIAFEKRQLELFSNER